VVAVCLRVLDNVTWSLCRDDISCRRRSTKQWQTELHRTT